MGVIQQKLRAFAIHFAISLIVILFFLIYIYFVAYTPPVLKLEGGSDIALIIFGVDLTLGPLMTLILYREGKRGLKFDLTLVAVVQIAAFLYGAWTLYSERPLYLAYTVEHFKIIPAASIDTDELSEPSLAPGWFRGPQAVYVERPTSQKEREKILFDSLGGGRDIQFLPEYYRPFRIHLDKVIDRAWTLERIKAERPQAAVEIGRAIQELGKKDMDVLLIPIMGHAREGAVVVDRNDGEILDYVDVTIW
jgi:hypothetical protein